VILPQTAILVFEGLRVTSLRVSDYVSRLS